MPNVIVQTEKTFFVDGRTFAVGGEVIANDETGWCGLRGRIKEINVCSNGEYTEVTILCDFEIPQTKNMREQVLRNFSEAYEKSLTEKDIPFKNVILQASSIEPIASTLPEPAKQLYALVCWWTEGISDIQPEILAVSNKKDVLLRKLDDHLKELEEDMLLDYTFFASDESCIEFCYSSRDLSAADAELYYAISKVPIFCCTEEDAA